MKVHSGITTLDDTIAVSVSSKLAEIGTWKYSLFHMDSFVVSKIGHICRITTNVLTVVNRLLLLKIGKGYSRENCECAKEF